MNKKVAERVKELKAKPLVKVRPRVVVLTDREILETAKDVIIKHADVLRALAKR